MKQKKAKWIVRMDYGRKMSFTNEDEFRAFLNRQIKRNGGLKRIVSAQIQ